MEKVKEGWKEVKREGGMKSGRGMEEETEGGKEGEKETPLLTH